MLGLAWHWPPLGWVGVVVGGDKGREVRSSKSSAIPRIITVAKAIDNHIY